MTEPTSQSDAPLAEQLVAYLDGELDDAARSRIEELLASDPQVRRMLQGMERTWELLDDLDELPVGEKFTQTTLEMVAVDAQRHIEQQSAEAPRRRRRKRLLLAGGLLGAMAGGFLAVMLLTPDTNRQLLQNLPVLENLDEYRQVEDVEFLRMLRDKGLFTKEDSDE